MAKLSVGTTCRGVSLPESDPTTTTTTTAASVGQIDLSCKSP